MRFVEWIEPFDDEAKYTLICKMSEEDVINWQKDPALRCNPNCVYKTDQQALDDFVVVHWARIIEENTN